MLFSYNWLQSFFEKKLPKPEKLAELLTKHIFEVEEIKKIDKDFVLDIDVLPNRGSDCFAHLGIAEEISAITNLSLQEPFSPVKEDKAIKAKDFIGIEVRNKTACPRYTVRVITGVKVGPSSQRIKQRLEVCGLRSINNIVDVANYVMLETGQPLHVFDGEKIEGKKIIVRFAKKSEKIITLDGEKYDLNKDVLVIADAKKPVAIAGIKGGKMPEVSEGTKVVVLESANFNPKIIRTGSKNLGLKTDASWRFEHGIDPNLTEIAINRAANLIQEAAGGNIVQGLLDFYPEKVLAKKITLNLDYVENLLGREISKIEIKKILSSLGMESQDKGSGQIEVIAPTWRLDVSLPEDLIEEIGRISGYGKIKNVFPVASLIPPERNEGLFWENIVKDAFKESGFSEVYNYSFISEKDAESFSFKKELVEFENPLSLEFKYLRPSLIPNLLKNIQENQKYFQEIKIFELGKIFKWPKSGGVKNKIAEKRMLGGAMILGQKGSSSEVFYQLKGMIDSLLNKLGISNVWYDSYRPTPEDSEASTWHPKICAEIKIDGEEIGFLGEIAPKVINNFKIKGKVVLFDIDFEKLSKLTSEEQEYRPISPYPAAIRDLAVLVPQGVLVEEVLNRINRIGGLLVRDVDLFDIYEGEGIVDG
ncbi:phenylalanine--tRNA ligase subunit beta, partial [Patescibacteria group bacterium]|nr:phenylalanine--tRNA ligase subunit beta [Patescibacteria group bacterium]